MEERSVEDLFKRGNERFAAGDFDSAIADYGAALELSPREPALYQNRGLALHAKGRLDEAVADLGRVIELNPKSAAAYRLRANILHRQARLEPAVADYTRVLELEPGDVPSWTHRGMARKDLEDYDGAVADCTRAIELDPKQSEPWRIRGFARQQKDDSAGAVADYEKSLELNPAQAQVAADLVHARQAAGLFCDTCLKQSGPDGPGNLSSMGGLGKTFYGDSEPCRACGSVVRTLWIILFHLPLIPLGSYRILQRSFRREAVGTREGFSARSVPLAGGQIVGTWMKGLLAVAAFTGAIVALVSSATSKR